MAKNDKRFVEIYSQSSFLSEDTILVDRVTGVNYLWHAGSQSGGLTVLLDRDGKPVISPLPVEA